MQKTAQHSVHPTLGILRTLQAVFYALSFFWLDGFAVPTPARVTQTVGPPLQIVVNRDKMSIYSVLKNYLNLTEQFLDDKQEAWRQTKSDFLGKRGYTQEDLENGSLGAIASLWVLDLDDEDSDVVLTNWSGFPNNINSEFPSLFRRSLFITSYSIFENRLYNRCKYMEKEFEIKLSVNDVTGFGRGIKRSKHYLEKVVGFEFPKSNNWSNILSYSKVRNCFVHNNGSVNGSDGEKFLRNYVLKHKFLELDYDEIIIKKEFCEETIRDFEKFEDDESNSFSRWLETRYSKKEAVT